MSEPLSPIPWSLPSDELLFQFVNELRDPIHALNGWVAILRLKQPIPVEIIETAAKIPDILPHLAEICTLINDYKRRCFEAKKEVTGEILLSHQMLDQLVNALKQFVKSLEGGLSLRQMTAQEEYQALISRLLEATATFEEVYIPIRVEIYKLKGLEPDPKGFCGY